MSAHWQQIMQVLDLMHTHFTYANMTSAAEGMGLSPSNDTLRSQMSDYKRRGWVEAAGLGAFKLTDAGRLAAGIEMSTKDKASDAGTPEAFGRVAELEDRPKTSEQRPFRKGENVGSSPTPPSSHPEPELPSPDFDDDIPF